MFGLSLVREKRSIFTKVLKIEMLPFKKMLVNDTGVFYSYDTQSSGFALYQSSLNKDKGLRVNSECFNNIINLLNESPSVENLHFSIDYLNSQYYGLVNAKLYIEEY